MANFIVPQLITVANTEAHTFVAYSSFTASLVTVGITCRKAWMRLVHWVSCHAQGNLNKTRNSEVNIGGHNET